MLQCVICGKKRSDGNGDYVKEDFCQWCLYKEVKFLEEVIAAREKGEASPAPAKDSREA